MTDRLSSGNARLDDILNGGLPLHPSMASLVSGLGLPLADGLRLENDLSTLLRTTEDRVEGAKAFVEKRKPKWTGR